MKQRHYTFLDKLIMQVDAGLSAVFAQQQAERANPAAAMTEPELTDQQRRQSIGLMRVNHSGEVCAQALYQSQLLLARSSDTREMLQHSAQEEIDHLAWTHQRLQELGGNRSYLNVFWYMNSFVMGLLAGLVGDRWSLGFVEETEKQVEAHLQGHLEKLPAVDTKSRKIVEQMRDDEKQHGQLAAKAGASALPWAVRTVMRCHARVMTLLAYRI